MQLNEKIAIWASGLRYADIPPAVIASTKLRILDIVGCILAGANSPEVTRTRSSALETFPGQGCRAIGFAGDISTFGAALVNGTAALALEFDDSHLESAIHVSSPVVSAAIPAVYAADLDGKTLIAAVAVGNELTCQLGVIAPGKFHLNGFHPTGVFGVFGAIYAVAKCLSFDTIQTANAIGIGGSMSAALMASWEDGSAAKSLHAGFAASAAINATSLARHGITGPKGVFDGRFGFFKAHVQDKSFVFPFDAMAARLGQQWEALNIAPKAYPSGHYIQPLIDAALALQKQHNIQPDQITAIICSMPDFVVPLVAAPEQEKKRPRTPFHGRFSLHHSMAEALLTGGLTKRNFAEANLTDPRYNAIADKVQAIVDPAMTDRRVLGGTVEFRLADGRTVSHTVDHMRGMPQNPMSVDDLAGKFRANADGILSAADAARCVDDILNLDGLGSIRPLIQKLSQ